MANASGSEGDITVDSNNREHIEMSIKGTHMSIKNLTEKIKNDSTLWPKILQKAKNPDKLKSNIYEDKPKILDYLCNDVPAYPTPVQFHVSTVTHVTTEQPFREIMESQKFRPPSSDYSWWSLKINDEEIESAEKLYLQENFPNLTREEVESHEPFLKKFTDSPVFQPKSRYGNYRFTFPLTQLMELYQEQNCGGEEPVLRVFKTMFYKQEIMYAVLIHSPQDNKLFEKLPLLEDSSFARYEDGKVIWTAQAISDNIKYKIFTSDTGVEVEGNEKKYYVWDHVGLAFHLPEGGKDPKVLKVPFDSLITAIEACELHEINFQTGNPAALYETAKKVVNEVKAGNQMRGKARV